MRPCEESNWPKPINRDTRLSNLTLQAKELFDEGLLFSNDPDSCEQAASKFREVIQLHPDYARAHFELGRMYYRWGHHERAHERYEWCVQEVRVLGIDSEGLTTKV